MRLFSGDTNLFLRKYFQVTYAVILLLLIPIAVVLNSVFLIQNSQKVIDVELERKAYLATSLFSSLVQDDIDQLQKVQSYVDRITSASDEIYGLDVLVPNGEDFRVIVSVDPSAVGTVTSFLNYTIAWKTHESIAYTTQSSGISTAFEGTKADRGSERFWVVTSPVKDSAGEKVALVSMKISSKIIDDLTEQNINRSVLVLVITIVIIVLLLITNTRLFEYAMLFRKLKEVDQMKDDFISMASHELRTPITGIQGYLQMLTTNQFGPVEGVVLEKLLLIQTASKQLAELVEDLLNVSRIEQGRLKMSIAPHDLLAAVRNVIIQLEAQAKADGLTVSFEEPKKPFPEILCDPDRLRQGLVNLIGNAIKYTLKGSVRVTLVQKEHMAEVKIIDTGIGMSGKDRERLFEKFYRIQNRETNSVTGTGLGLWITKELIRLMKGEIYVDSIERVGTQVTVLLPLAESKK